MTSKIIDPSHSTIAYAYNVTGKKSRLAVILLSILIISFNISTAAAQGIDRTSAPKKETPKDNSSKQGIDRTAPKTAPAPQGIDRTAPKTAAQGIDRTASQGIDRTVNVKSTGISREQNTISRGIERSQQLGVQTVGEDTAQARKKVIKKVVHAPAGPEAELAKADKLLEVDRIDQAMEIYKRYLNNDKVGIDAHAGLGYAYIEKEDFESAIKELEFVVDQRPEDEDARLNLGVAYYRNGFIKESLDQYKYVLEHSKATDRAELYYNMGIATARQGTLDEAKDFLKKAIAERKDRYPEAYNNLGLICNAQGNPDEAIVFYKKAIELKNNNYAFAYYNLGEALRIKGGKNNEEAAMNNYKVALKQNDKFAEAYLAIGNLHCINGVKESNNNYLKLAEDNFRLALKVRNNLYPLAHSSLGLTLAKENKIEEAWQHFYLAFEQYDGRCPETLGNFIELIKGEDSFTFQNEQGKADNAGSLISGDKSKFLSELVTRTKRYLSMYEQDLSEDDKEHPIIRYCAGRSYLTADNLDKALEEFTEALALAKDDLKYKDIREDAQHAIEIINKKKADKLNAASKAAPSQ